MKKEEMLKTITDNLWEKANMGEYSCKDVKNTIEYMYSCNYSLISIPEEFASTYSEQYYKYVKSRVSLNPETIQAIHDIFIDEHPDEYGYLAIRAIKKNPELDKKIVERIDERIMLNKDQEELVEKLIEVRSNVGGKIKEEDLEK